MFGKKTPASLEAYADELFRALEESRLFTSEGPAGETFERFVWECKWILEAEIGRTWKVQSAVEWASKRLKREQAALPQVLSHIRTMAKWAACEKAEKLLASLRPPSELKGLHDLIVKQIRAIILALGSESRTPGSSLSRWRMSAITLQWEVDNEMSRIKQVSPEAHSRLIKDLGPRHLELAKDHYFFLVA